MIHKESFLVGFVLLLSVCTSWAMPRWKFVDEERAGMDERNNALAKERDEGNGVEDKKLKFGDAMKFFSRDKVFGVPPSCPSYVPVCNEKRTSDGGKSLAA